MLQKENNGRLTSTMEQLQLNNNTLANSFKSHSDYSSEYQNNVKQIHTHVDFFLLILQLYTVKLSQCIHVILAVEVVEQPAVSCHSCRKSQHWRKEVLAAASTAFLNSVVTLYNTVFWLFHCTKNVVQRRILVTFLIQWDFLNENKM